MQKFIKIIIHSLASKYVEVADFAHLKSQELISRKIWVIEKLCNFHTVMYHRYKFLGFVWSKLELSLGIIIVENGSFLQLSLCCNQTKFDKQNDRQEGLSALHDTRPK